MTAKTYCPVCGFESGCAGTPEPAGEIPVIWQDILARLSAAVEVK